MNRKNSEIIQGESLKSMSTDVLQELLNLEVERNLPIEVNVSLIKEIISILNSRTGKSRIDVAAAYAEFLSEYLGYEMLYPAGIE